MMLIIAILPPMRHLSELSVIEVLLIAKSGGGGAGCSIRSAFASPAYVVQDLAITRLIWRKTCGRKRRAGFEGGSS